MTKLHAGEVILVSFPYILGALGKQRPLLVLLDTGDNDVVAARITSKPKRKGDIFDCDLTDWKKAKLLRPSVVRIHKLITVEKKVEIQKKIGKLAKDDWQKVKKKIKQLWKPLIA